MFIIFWWKRFKILEEFNDKNRQEFICQVYSINWFLIKGNEHVNWKVLFDCCKSFI